MILSHRRNNKIKKREAETKNKLRMKMDWLKLKEDNLMDQSIRISRS